MRRALPTSITLALCGFAGTLAAQTPAAHTPAAQTPSVEPAPQVLDASLGLRMYGRSMVYTDDLFRRLRPYRVVGVPALAGEVTFYPGALVSRGAASWFGVVVGGELTPYLNSIDAQNRSYSTTAYTLSAGAIGHRTFGRVELSLALSYVRQVFSIDRSSVTVAPPEGIPSVTYESLRALLAARVRVTSRLSAAGSFGALLPLGFGELGSDGFFPRVSGGGVEASVGAGFALTTSLEARLTLDWRRYFLSMNPQRGDRLIAGGAADDFYGATLGVAFRR